MNEEHDMLEDEDDREDGEHAAPDDALDPALAARLEALTRAIEPRVDLWAGVASRIEAERVRARARRARVRSAMTALAIAASVAIGVGVHALRRGGSHAADARGGDAGPSHSSRVASLPSAPPSIVADPSMPALLPEEPAYRAAALALRASLAESRGDLQSKPARCIDDDLRLLDSAIEDTRAELVKSPDDQVLRAALRDAYQQEIDVLSDVIDLTSRT